MIETLLNIINYGGLPILFLLIFLEGNPIIGSFIPGQALVMLVGVLIATFRIFTIEIAFIVIFLAAYLGDIFGFYLGKKLGLDKMKVFGLSEKSEIFSMSKKFFKKYGLWSIFLGREFNLTRAFMPFLASIFNVRLKDFLFVALFSNLFWTGISLYLGYYFGFIIIEKVEFIFSFILLIIIYFTILYFFYKGYNYYYIKNKYLIKNYAINNILFSFILFIIILIFLSLSTYNNISDFNNYFKFLTFDLSKSLLYKIKISLSIFLISILFFLFYKIKENKFRLLVIFIWSFLFTEILFLIFNLLLKKYFHITLYPSIIFQILILFYINILFRRIYLKKLPSKSIIKFDFFIIFLIILIVFINCLYISNFYLIVLSFLFASFFCELILIFSHYKLLDSYFSRTYNK